jgi:hypothetical protein
MPRLGPTLRTELICGFRQLGFRGPYSGGKHQFIVREHLRVFRVARVGNGVQEDCVAGGAANVLRRAGTGAGDAARVEDAPTASSLRACRSMLSIGIVPGSKNPSKSIRSGIVRFRLLSSVICRTRRHRPRRGRRVLLETVAGRHVEGAVSRVRDAAQPAVGGSRAPRRSARWPGHRPGVRSPCLDDARLDPARSVRTRATMLRATPKTNARVKPCWSRA